MDKSSSIKEKEIIDSIESLDLSKTNDSFIKSSQNAIKLISLNLQSDFPKKDNFEDLVNKYYFPIINKILGKIPNFIDKKINNYDNNFIFILSQLYGDIYLNAKKIKSILEESKFREIIQKLFKNYNMYSFELLLCLLMMKFFQKNSVKAILSYFLMMMKMIK